MKAEIIKKIIAYQFLLKACPPELCRAFLDKIYLGIVRIIFYPFQLKTPFKHKRKVSQGTHFWVIL
jgi:hypothetical protein